MSYTDLQEHGSEAAVKAAGKLRQQGKPYESKRSSMAPCRILLTPQFAQWLMVILLIGSLAPNAQYVMYYKKQIIKDYVSYHRYQRYLYRKLESINQCRTEQES